MLNLTQTAYWTRRLLKIGAFLLIAIIFLRFSLRLFNSVWQKLHPPAPPPPPVSFGKLPVIKFPENSDLGIKVNYRLETIQGGLPKLPEIAKVFFIPKEGPNLLALQRATQEATKLGFSSEPQQISETAYR